MFLQDVAVSCDPASLMSSRIYFARVLSKRRAPQILSMVKVIFVIINLWTRIKIKERTRIIGLTIKIIQAPVTGKIPPLEITKKMK
jgi:hypothetical protein